MNQQDKQNKEDIKTAITPDIPDYSRTERNKIPKQFTWKTEDLYPDLSSWEKDKTELTAMISRIPELSQEWTTSPEAMYRLMSHVTETEKKENRTYLYTSLSSDTDMSDSAWQARKGELYSVSVDFGAMLSFMDPDILELGKAKIETYIQAEPRLEVYRRDFEAVLRMEQHVLSADKEQIVTRSGMFSNTPSKAAGILRDVDIPAPQLTLSSGEKIRLNTSNYVRHRASEIRGDRKKVMRAYWKNQTRYRNTHAALMDGAIKSHYFQVGVRNYNSCLEAALFPNNIDTAVYHNLISTVQENLAPLHRYLKLKARMLKLDRMEYEDIYASSVPAAEKKFTIEQAKQMVLESLEPLGDEYGTVLKTGFESRWMDIYANKGKRSGAYSNGSGFGAHPFVLMNYNGTLNHVSTLAHEFGHSLHSWFSNKYQPFPLSHYPIFLAEVASTFNETLLVHYMMEKEKDPLFKLHILDGYLEDLRGTLFRQSLFANFEAAMHEHVEKGQTLTADWLDTTYLNLTRLYYGHKENVTKVDKYIQSEWCGIPHFYYNFYVYQYSTGISAATALADMVIQGGKAEQERYLDFLKSGRTKYPLDALKDAGVDLTTPAPIITTIRKFDETLDRMETLLTEVS